MNTRQFKILLIAFGTSLFFSIISICFTFDKPNRLPDKVDSYLEKKINDLVIQNVRLQNSIDSLRQEYKFEQNKLLLLAEQKQKIQIVYVDKIKAIDNYSDSDIIQDFNLFFSKKNRRK